MLKVERGRGHRELRELRALRGGRDSRVTDVVDKDCGAFAHRCYSIFLHLRVGWEDALCESLDHCPWH